MSEPKKRKLVRVNIKEDPGYIHIDSFRASDIVMCTQGSTIIGATEDGPTVRVPWTQHNMIELSCRDLPHAPTMVNIYGEIHYPFAGFDKPFPHQFRIAGFLSSHKRGFCLADPGCVDGSTEYLSPTGWVAIKDYVGGKVLQYDPETELANFVEPIKYINEPAKDMIHFKTSRGIDMMLSGQHRVLYKDKYTGTGYHTTTALELAQNHWDSKYGFVGGIPTAFRIDGLQGVKLSDELLRVIVMYVADGTFDSRRSSNRVTLNLKKRRKIERAVRLLTAADIEYRVSTNETTGYTRVYFTAPVRTKDFDLFWAATYNQLKVICKEVEYWDGTTRSGNRACSFSTSVKEVADFVQYAFTATGTRTSIGFAERVRFFKTLNKVYTNHTSEYTVNPSRQSSFTSLHNSNGGDKKNQLATIVPAPEGRQYCFEVPSTYLVLRRNGRVFCTGNTGKTACATWASDYLIRIGEAKRVLIICPVSLLSDTWAKELALVCPHNSVSVIDGTKDRRVKQLAVGSTYDIINYDGVQTCFDDLNKIKYDIIIIDESTAYKNINNRWQYINKLSKGVTYLWLMTGTPTPHSPEDAYGQVKLVNPDWKMTKSAWKYTVMDRVSEFRYVPKPNAKELVLAVMKPAIYVSKKDALPFLPPVTFSFRGVGLSEEQETLVKELKDKRIGTTANGTEINAVHAAALMSKLVQICSGSVYDEFRNVIHVDNSNRDNELLDIVRKARDCEYNDGTANNKVIVFCAFVHTVHRVTALLVSAGFRAEYLTGDVSTTNRRAVFGRVQNTSETEVLVAIPEVAAHGLTLTAACTTVWYSPITKAELFNQANNRMDRPSQKNPMQIIKLYGTYAEKLMYNNLLTKQENQRDILSGYSQIVAAINNN